MLVFALTNFAGYGHAHVVSRYLRPRAQALTHAGLLGVATLLLPTIRRGRESLPHPAALRAPF